MNNDSLGCLVCGCIELCECKFNEQFPQSEMVNSEKRVRLSCVPTPMSWSTSSSSERESASQDMYPNVLKEESMMSDDRGSSFTPLWKDDDNHGIDQYGGMAASFSDAMEAVTIQPPSSSQGYGDLSHTFADRDTFDQEEYDRESEEKSHGSQMYPPLLPYHTDMTTSRPDYLTEGIHPISHTTATTTTTNDLSSSSGQDISGNYLHDDIGSVRLWSEADGDFPDKHVISFLKKYAVSPNPTHVGAIISYLTEKSMEVHLDEGDREERLKAMYIEAMDHFCLSMGERYIGRMAVITREEGEEGCEYYPVYDYWPSYCTVEDMERWRPNPHRTIKLYNEILEHYIVISVFPYVGSGPN